MDKNTKMKNVPWKTIQRKKLPCWEYSDAKQELYTCTHLLYPASVLGIEDAADIAFGIDLRDTWVDITIWQKVGERFFNDLLGSYMVQERTIQEIEDALREFPYRGVDGWQKHLDMMVEAGEWIPKFHIAPMIEAGCAEKYLAHREEMLAMRREEEKEKEAARRAREEEERQREREEEAAFDKMVDEAVMTIRTGGRFVNEDGRLVLSLAERAGVAVPLRSNGWIREWLYAVTVQEGHVVSVNLTKKGGKVSDKMFALLDKVTAFHYAAKEVPAS